jgi:hypothetical protein
MMPSRSQWTGGGETHRDGCSCRYRDAARRRCASFGRGGDYGYAMRELDKLTDHDLRDVGITRAGILDCTWSEACRRDSGDIAR